MDAKENDNLVKAQKAKEKAEKALAKQLKKLQKIKIQNQLANHEEYPALASEEKELKYQLHKCRIRQSRKRYSITKTETKMQNVHKELSQQLEIEIALVKQLDAVEIRKNQIVSQLSQ